LGSSLLIILSPKIAGPLNYLLTEKRRLGQSWGVWMTVETSKQAPGHGEQVMELEGKRVIILARRVQD
jgi:hypothetical protein